MDGMLGYLEYCAMLTLSVKMRLVEKDIILIISNYLPIVDRN